MSQMHRDVYSFPKNESTSLCIWLIPPAPSEQTILIA